MKISFRKLLTPVLILVTIIILLLVAARGWRVENQSGRINLLDEPVETFLNNTTDESEKSVLVVYDGEMPISKQIVQNVDSVMRIIKRKYTAIDVDALTADDIRGCEKLLVCTGALEFLTDKMPVFLDWLEDGGKYAQLILPESNSAFQMIYRKLGIMEYNGDYMNYTGFQIMDSFIPIMEDYVVEGEGVSDFCMIAHLEPSCNVHAIGFSSEGEIPLIWDTPVKKGHVVVVNNTMMQEKTSLGLIIAAISTLDDVMVYPITNAFTMFIDDFPAPQPDGFDQRLMQQFGYDIQGFFINHWWPDMRVLCDEYDIKYTGLLIETYNKEQHAPFPEGSAKELDRYYGAQLLNAACEIGWHGYNHQPLCLEGFDYGDVDDYTPWDSIEDMKIAMRELARFAKHVFPETDMHVYVPPSNMIDSTGRQAVATTLPELRVISGVYVQGENENEMCQDFTIQPDGIIDYPRVSYGYQTDAYQKLNIANALVLYGVFSHFIHPDDVLDDDRGAALGWRVLYSDLKSLISMVKSHYPQIRGLTATNSAAALQRCLKLTAKVEDSGPSATIRLEGFVDEGWLALRTQKTPQDTEGGELYRISNGFYWLHAVEDTVVVQWEEAE